MFAAEERGGSEGVDDLRVWVAGCENAEVDLLAVWVVGDEEAVAGGNIGGRGDAGDLGFEGS